LHNPNASVNNVDDQAALDESYDAEREIDPNLWHSDANKSPAALQGPLAGRRRGFECGLRTTKSIHSISPHEGTRSETMIISSWILSSIVPQKPNLSPTLEASRRSARTAMSRAEARTRCAHEGGSGCAVVRCASGAHSTSR
jgi:hypothetical protein